MFTLTKDFRHIVVINAVSVGALVWLISFVFSLGYSSSASKYFDGDFKNIITLRGESSVNVEVLATYEMGVLVLDSEKKIHFLFWPQIIEMQMPAEQNGWVGLLCSGEFDPSICRKKESLVDTGQSEK